MSVPRRPVLIMAGGTGGHVYPALAVAEHLRGLGVPLLWLGTRRGLEARVVPARGFTLLTIRIGGLRGKGWFSWVTSPAKLLLALLHALALLVRNRPAVVLGMGGFASGPGGVAAWLMRVPLLIHEQNAVLGLTNQLLAPLAVRAMEAFPGTFAPNRHAAATGNPVRAEFTETSPPAQRLAAPAGRLRVLVLGGSLGARALNEIVPAALARMPREGLEIRHQTGAHDVQRTEQAYREAGLPAQVLPYIEDVAAAYRWADVAVCRAGALTIAEIAAVGLAAVLVPYPFAVDDHQTANARYLVDAGAAVLLPQPELSAERLAEILQDLRRSRPRLIDMAERARKLSRPEATAQVAQLCLEAAHG